MAAVMAPMEERGISPREYAQREGISLQAAYLRCWRGKVPCRQVLGRYWVIFVPKQETEREAHSA